MRSRQMTFTLLTAPAVFGPAERLAIFPTREAANRALKKAARALAVSLFMAERRMFRGRMFVRVARPAADTPADELRWRQPLFGLASAWCEKRGLPVGAFAPLPFREAAAFCEGAFDLEAYTGAGVAMAAAA